MKKKVIKYAVVITYSEYGSNQYYSHTVDTCDTREQAERKAYEIMILEGLSAKVREVTRYV